MIYDFDTLLDKKGMGNMKYINTPLIIKEKGIISYSGAEMEFITAPSIEKALKAFVEKGCYGFTVCDDLYLNTVSRWLKSQRDFYTEKDWIVPTHGTIFSLSTAIRAFTKEGEGIIVSPPVYHRYKQAAERLGRKTVYNDLIEKDCIYTIDFNDLEEKFKDKNNRLYVLCNPHNPISKVWKKEDLENIAYLSKKYGIVVFSDEIFAEVVFNGNTVLPYSSVKNAADNAIVATSLGKAFSFTGVNHANIIIPNNDLRAHFITQRNRDHYGSIDPMLYAAIQGAYSEEGALWKDKMVEYVEENGKLFIDFFNNNFPYIKISPYEGTYAIWVDWRNLSMDSKTLDSFLINKAYLHTDSGEDYGTSGAFTRLSVAVPKNEIYKSLDYLYPALKKVPYNKNI